jgi:hypothetical protein
MAADGFLSRWSRRKLDAKEGKPLEEAPVATPAPEALEPGPPPVVFAPAEPAELPPQKPPAPTIEDVRALTFESDFSRFVTPDVAPEVKNAAVKKLFADPRYNVRDMMDVYADDYSLPDPIPESMMRQLASAKFLGLFEEKDTGGEGVAREVADDVPAENVAQSPSAIEEVVPESPHADADLRLQQDDAPAGEEPGDGAGRGTLASHDPVPPRSGELPESDQG